MICCAAALSSSACRHASLSLPKKKKEDNKVHEDSQCLECGVEIQDDDIFVHLVDIQLVVCLHVPPIITHKVRFCFALYVDDINFRYLQN